MLNVTNTLNSPVRSIKAKVELYNGSTLVDTYSYNDELQEITIDRLGEDSKFFGFGVFQKATIKLRDSNREKEITTANSFKIYFSDGGEFISNYPTFYVTEVNRDENTNQLSITAYDGLKFAEKHTVEELELDNEQGYTVAQVAYDTIQYLGYNGYIMMMANSEDYLINGANFDGAETLKEALDDIAEYTHSIYYLNHNNILVFKELHKEATALTITKQDYITLESKTNRTLAAITSTNELGDAVTASLEAEGVTQFIRDNVFLELREDIADLIDNAIAAIGGLTINQFSCSWRGNYLLEIGDKIELVTKDDNSVISYVLNDTLTYNGGLKEQTSWNYTDNEGETATNPTTIGEAIKQTYAKVDKVNKQIDIVASESSANNEAIAALQLNTQSISATVSSLETTTAEALENNSEEIANLKNSVAAQITPEAVTILVKSELENGVTKVETSTGVIVDDRGLTVNKSDSEMETTISDDGMKVFRNDEAMLTADGSGVNAKNLHATTYLKIGNNSRFQDFGNRTACFWIGGRS